MFGRRAGGEAAVSVVLPVEFVYSRVGLASASLIILLLVVFGMAIVADGEVFGCLLLGPGAGLALPLSRSAMDRRPVLRIDTQGIFDRRHMDRPVPWTAVQGIEEVPMQGKTWILLLVAEPTDWVDGWWRRLFLRLNGAFLRRRCLYTTSSGLTGSTTEIRQAILTAIGATPVGDTTGA